MKNIIFNPEKNFMHNGKLYSLYTHYLINGIIITHSLGEIPHTVSIENGCVVLLANANKQYLYKMS